MSACEYGTVERKVSGKTGRTEAMRLATTGRIYEPTRDRGSSLHGTGLWDECPEKVAATFIAHEGVSE